MLFNIRPLMVFKINIVIWIKRFCRKQRCVGCKTNLCKHDTHGILVKLTRDFFLVGVGREDHDPKFDSWVVEYENTIEVYQDLVKAVRAVKFLS